MKHYHRSRAFFTGTFIALVTPLLIANYGCSSDADNKPAATPDTGGIDASVDTDASDAADATPIGWQPEIGKEAFMELLSIEYSRVVEGTKLDTYLNSNDAKIAAAATRTLGRISASYAVPAGFYAKLLSFAAHTAPEVRGEAANALAWSYAREADAGAARTAIVEALAKETNVAAKRLQLVSIGTVGTPADVPLLITHAKSADIAVREAALIGLYLLFGHKDVSSPTTPWLADDEFVLSLCDWMLSSADPATEQAAQLLYVLPPQFVASEPVRAKIIDTAKNAKSPFARYWMFWQKGGLSGADLAAHYAALSRDSDASARANWASFANYQIPVDGALASRLVEMLGDPSRAVRLAASSTLSNNVQRLLSLLAPNYAQLRGFYDVESGSVKANLLAVLAGVDGPRTESLVRDNLNASDVVLRARALRLFAPYAVTGDQSMYVAALASNEPGMNEAAMTSIAAFKAADFTPSLKNAVLTQVSAGNAVVVGRLGESEFSAIHAWPELGAALANAYPILKAANAHPWTMVSLAAAITNAKATAQTSIVAELCASTMLYIASNARASYKELTGNDYNATPLPAAPPASVPLPDFAAIQQAMSAKIRWTVKGKQVVIAPNPLTPMTATAYYQRVKSGFYAGSVPSWNFTPYVAEVGNTRQGSYYGLLSQFGRNELGSPLDFGVGSVTFWGTQDAPDNVGQTVSVMLNNRFYNARQNGFSTAFGKVESGLDALVDIGVGESFDSVSVAE